MLKAIHIVYQFPKLSETFILDQIVGLIKLGCNIKIFAFNPPSEGKIDPLVDKYNLLSHTSYFNIPQTRLERFYCLISNLNLFNRNKRNKLKKLIKEPHPFYRFINRLHLASFFSEDYKIIHCHYGTLGEQFLFLKSLYNYKLIVSFHGFDLSQTLRKEKDMNYSKLFKRADALLPISKYWKEKLISLGAPSNKIYVHYMGIDPNLFTYKERKVDKKVLFLTIGRLVEKKGIEYAIHALAKLAHKYPQIHFEYYIVGDGPLKEKLQNIVKNYKLEKQIKFLGWLTRNEIKSLLQSCHIFLLPSITSSDGDMEGIPIVLMEAMASGLPVISTYHSGIPELIIDGKTGLLVPEKNYDLLYLKIITLIKDKKLYSTIKKKAREYIVKNFNINTQNKKLYTLYQNLLQK